MHRIRPVTMRELALALPLLVAGTAGAAVEPPLDGTYRVSQDGGDPAAAMTWIFRDGRLVFPDQAPCTSMPAADGIDIQWRAVTQAPQLGMGFDICITQLLLAQLQAHPGNGMAVAASAGSGASQVQPTTETVHAHLAADGTLSGQMDTASGSFHTGSWRFTGRRVGPARQPRQMRTWRYHTDGDAGQLRVTTDAVILLFPGVDGKGVGAGAWPIDGEERCTGRSGALCQAYEDGVETVTCNRASVRIVDGGRALIAGSTRIELHGGRPTIRIDADGQASVLGRERPPVSDGLRGRSFAVTLHHGTDAAQDTLRFTPGGRCDLATFTSFDELEPYRLERHGDRLIASLNMRCEPLGSPVALALTATIDGHAVTGTATLAGDRGPIFAFDFAGTEVSDATDNAGASR